jgi:nicotinamidase/pyrazinamidase
MARNFTRVSGCHQTPSSFPRGADLHKDQYSAFDATGLTDELRRRGIRRVIICGLALDVCVRASALDAARAGFETRVMRQATRPVSNQDGERAILEMTRACAATIMMAGSSS